MNLSSFESRPHGHRRIAAAVTLAALLSTVDVVAQSTSAPPKSADAATKDSESDSRWTPSDRVRFTNESASHYYYTSPEQPDLPPLFFFPPVPPPLGSESRLPNPFVRGHSAPAELADFVNECFYPALAARLVAGDLSKVLQRRLQAYRSDKAHLQSELRSRIAALDDVDLASRAHQLADLAAAQAPRIAELEATAETIRTDLRRTDFLGQTATDDDWLSLISPPSTAATDAPAPAESELWRAAAFFQDGLSIEQRQLLRSAAIERNAEFGAAHPAANRSKPAARLLYFLPAPASFPLPATLPSSLVREIDAYVEQKQILTAELADTLKSLRKARSERTDAVRRLAAAQAPRLLALEALAEQIRRDLAALPTAPGPATAPVLPPDLAARIATYRRHKQEALKTLYELLAADAKAAEVVRTAPSDDGTRVVLRVSAASTRGKSAELRESVAAFNHQQAALVDELNREKAGIREALSNYMRKEGRAQDQRSVDDLLKDFEDARQREEAWAKFRDYQTAVLMPGLSPGQRRLLFDAAIGQISPPLPVSESPR